MKNKIMMGLAVLAMATLVVGCAITDYNGIPGHKTTGEAKLWGAEISFSGFGADFDGTYSYTVKYGSGGHPVTINSLRNPVVSSFSRDGLVDRDGNDVLGNSGTAGGKFGPWIVSVDNAGGCQFGANVTQDKGAGAGVFLCIDGSQEEVDRDFELNAAFGSIDDLVSRLLAGTLTGQFTVELTGITINGVTHQVAPVSIGATATGTRPNRLTLVYQPTVPGLLQTILDNTNHMEFVDLGFQFDGGLGLSLPHVQAVAFNHDVLIGML